MNKKKILLVSIIIAISILVVLSIFVIKIFFIGNSPERVLSRNKYKLVKEYQVKEESGVVLSNYDFKKYSKDNISIYVFDYNTHEEAKKYILDVYNQEKDNDIKVYLYEGYNYIIKKRCDRYDCDYQIGYKNYLISSLEDIQYSEEIENILKKIVGYKIKID